MKDKVIVITGASSGIGAALAELIAARGGAKGLVLAARRQAELTALARRLPGHNLAVPTDVTVRGQVEQLRDRAIAELGHIDVWIGNAGRGITRSVTELTDADIDDMVAINVKSVLYGVQAVLPHFRDRNRGHLITVSSMLGRISMAPIRSAYSAAKAAVNSLMASLRLELRSEYPDIHISTVMPGVVATDFGINALHGGPDSRALPQAQPVGEVAAAIAGLIDRPRAELYTRPEHAQLAARYFTADDVATIEAGPPFTAMPRR
ncbi:MAG TPA: SDR family NAD(P)-dependent oxidoreductase [Kofleriaceae bacterium]|nr:SDR family NAD(P)-dependent oxidoreductase [Kofleriaceae bacterium]